MIIEMTLKEYNSIPYLYGDDMQIKRLKMKVGDYYIMREPADDKEVGDVCSVYEIIRLTETGHESKVTTIRITR